MNELRGQRVLVAGLGRSGLAAAHLLARHGAVVTVTDTRLPSAFSAHIPGLLAEKVGLELGRHDEETFLRQDLIVVSPGIPWDMPHLAEARRRGIVVMPEVELAAILLPGILVGITGSNGKTTTTALLGNILKASGLPTFVGGNIGVPLISAVEQTTPETLLVTELSSFQLEAARELHPHVAVLLNLTPNHLDRHPSFEAYVEAKARIFQRQTAKDYAVLNADDPRVAALAPGLAAQTIFFSRRQKLADGVLVEGGHIIYRRGTLERALLDVSEVPLRGAFNIENVLAAAAAACLLGADFAALRRAVREFPGVEHRLEFVREIRGAAYFNDSKATSVDAAAKALSAFEQGVHLILGGKDKGAPYAPLRPLMISRVRAAYLIGAAEGRLARELEGTAELVHAGDLETALRQAASRARPGETVLLAPACSSYDQFQDFEERGRKFKEIVARLAEEPAPARVPEGVAAEAGRGASPDILSVSGPETVETAESPLSQDKVAAAALPSTGSAQPVPALGGSLHYVFEVDEEFPEPLDYDFADDSDFAPLDPDELAPPEELTDEALMFEIRDSGNGQSSAESNSKREANAPEPPAVSARPEKP